MQDSLIAKLERMAARGTPHEAAIARAKLIEMRARVFRQAGEVMDGLAEQVLVSAEQMTDFYAALHAALKRSHAEGRSWRISSTGRHSAGHTADSRFQARRGQMND